MPDPAVADQPITETVTETPTPIGDLDSLSEYRARRGEVKTGEDAEAVEEKPKAEAKTEGVKEEAVADPDPASEAGKALAKKKGSLQGRIDELTREKHQTASEAAAAKAEAAALKAELAALKAGKTEPKAEPVAATVDPNDPKPDVSRFEDYGEYTEALTDWKVRQALKAADAKNESRTRERAMSVALARVYEHGTQAHDDYNERVLAYEAAGGQYSTAAQGVILNHELGHEFAYRMVTDPSVAARINGAENASVALLEAGAVLAEIKAEMKAAEKPEPKPKPVSKAPVPVEPLTGEQVAATPDPANMNSVSEWRKHRQKFLTA
jgi:hypothetical protein